MNLKNRLNITRNLALGMILAASSIGYSASAQRDKSLTSGERMGITSYCDPSFNTMGRQGVELPSGQVVKNCEDVNKYFKEVSEEYAKIGTLETPEGISPTHEHNTDRKLTDAFTRLDQPYPASFCVPVNYDNGDSRAIITLLNNSIGDKSYSVFPFKVHETNKAARKDCANFVRVHKKYNKRH